MPADLIKFLNDAGPLERSVDKELTSTKVYDALVTDENAREEQAKKANLRVRRKMPIMAQFGDDGEGTMTERSTNFSTVDRSGLPVGLGVTREQLFQMSENVKELKADSPAWKEAIEAGYERVSNNVDKSENLDQLKNMALFEDSLRYIGVPAIMKDNEDDLIGVWHFKVDELKHSSGLKLVPENSIHFAMQNEGGATKES